MEEFEVLSSLYTPVSDLALGDVNNADAEAIFGRAGNDNLRVYSPQAIAGAQSQNVDYIFGDIFDNNQEEREVIRGIQEGTNPLGILDIGPPSVGADRFLLGDINGPYYDDDISGTTSDNIFNNFFGLNDYSVIYDFNPEQDVIQLNGSPDDYLLVDINNLPVANVEQEFFGKGLFLLKENKLDLVSYIIERPEVELNLTDGNFAYVDKADKATQKKSGQIGTPGIDVSNGSATDSEGNVYLTGFTSGSLGGNQGGFDVWVAKFDPKGKEVWRQQFGSSSGERAYGIEIDKDDNVFLAGQTEGNLFGELQSAGSDVWVAKLDGSSGEQIWGQQYGTNVTGGFSNGSFDLAVDDEGDVYASGLAIKESFLPVEVFDFPIQDDAFVVKFDGDNGDRQWFTTISSPLFDESYGIDVDNQGNVYATGWSQALVRESDPGRDLLKYDYWLAKLDANDGTEEYRQQFNSSNNGIDFAWDVETDSQGNAYVNGWTSGDLAGSNGSYDPFLAKYNPDGSQEWVRQFGTGGDDGSYTVSFDIDTEDNIYVTGYTNSNLGGANQGQKDAWVAKYNSDGVQQWTQQLGSTKTDYGTDVVANESGEVFVTGFTDGSLGDKNAGAEDAWVAKLDADSGDIEKFDADIKGGKGKRGKDKVKKSKEEVAITESLDEVFAPDENGFTAAFGAALSQNSNTLTFEDETGAELEEVEIEQIEGIEVDGVQGDGEVSPEEDSTSNAAEVVANTPAAEVVANTPAADVVGITPASI